MEYYYHDGVNSVGPFTLEQLRGKNISRNTPVWHSGMQDWKPAGEVASLAQLFGTPPPITALPPQFGTAYGTPTVPPKTWLLESILVTLFCCLPFGIAGIVNASKVESRFYSGDTDGARRSSEEAGKWTKIGFWTGLIFGVIYLVIVLVAGFSGLDSDFPSF